MSVPRIPFGTRLQNNAQVVQFRSTNGTSVGVVLCWYGWEWVTWRMDANRLDSTESGHYFADLAEAVKDFNER